MTANFPGPLEARIFYTVSNTIGGPIQHVMKLNFTLPAGHTITPGQSFGTISVQIRSGVPVTLQAAIDGFITVVRPLYDLDDSTFDYAECWEYTPGTFDARFISTYNIGLAGSNTSPGESVAASQNIMVFRTQEGGIMKLSLMEGKSGVALPRSYAQLASDSKAVVDYVLSTNIWMLARDTSYPLSFKAQYLGQNEALFKRRYRP